MRQQRIQVLEEDIEALNNQMNYKRKLVSRARLSYAGRESGQIPIRLWCCILSSSVLNEVGVNMIGTCSEKAGFP